MTRRLMIVGIVVIVALVLAGCSSDDASDEDASNPLSGTAWEWTQLTETSPASQSVVPNPSAYTLTFNDDGTFTGNADCNSISGNYTAGDGQFTFTLGPSTLAECGPDSLYNVYVTNLGSADTFQRDNNTLTLGFGGGSGEMTFQQQ